MAREAGPKMRGQMVRFGRTQWAIIRRHANAEGVSASQFVRDAAWKWAVQLESRDGTTPDHNDLRAFLDECEARFPGLLVSVAGIEDEDEDGDEEAARRVAH